MALKEGKAGLKLVISIASERGINFLEGVHMLQPDHLIHLEFPTVVPEEQSFQVQGWVAAAERIDAIATGEDGEAWLTLGERPDVRAAYPNFSHAVGFSGHASLQAVRGDVLHFTCRIGNEIIPLVRALRPAVSRPLQRKRRALFKNACSPTPRQAARFLMQATLGASTEDIAHVCDVGYEAWIDEQFQLEQGITHTEVHEHRLAGRHFEMHHAWWRQVLTSPDLLRQRLAVALTELFVISEMSIEFVPWEMMEYYDDLGRLSFGNWRDLLKSVSLDPLMGYYLSHLKNRKPNPALQRYPDENYAREVMQLFSIGLWELNQDGTRRHDSQGREIPTYGNLEVTHFARVFTGLGFGGPLSDVNKPEDFLNAPADYGNPMKLWEEEHDQEEKILLCGTRLPAFANTPGRKGMDDIDDAVDNLFQHPNVGPFFGRLLIQRLVTSNPSPGYIGRVARAFEDNGQGIRGDLKAVIKAVLLDDEARNPVSDGVVSGRLREPYLRYVKLARTFKARSKEGSFRINDHNTQEATGQILLNAPSVFNFFLPDYQPSGPISEAGLYAPEFQIMTSTTAITSLNRYTCMIASGFGDEAHGPTTFYLDFDEEIELADEPTALIDLLNLKMTGGSLTEGTIEILLTAYRELPAAYSAEEKVKAIVQLITVSPDFAVFQ